MKNLGAKVAAERIRAEGKFAILQRPQERLRNHLGGIAGKKDRRGGGHGQDGKHDGKPDQGGAVAPKAVPKLAPAPHHAASMRGSSHR